MKFVTLDSLVCPLDGDTLTQCDETLRCAAGHSFDIARQGYVNLLGAADKRSKDPGDSKLMIAARASFLDAGVYRELARHLCQVLAPLLQDTPDACILDAGCGEGYYLQQLQAGVANSATLVGSDISKWAVRAATRRDVTATWLVASNRHLPLASASVDIVLDMFGFASPGEFGRVLKPGGRILQVDAGAEHLIELRQLIYAEVRKSPAPAIHPEFRCCAQSHLRSTTGTLSNAQLRQLLQMTPHLFRANAAARARAVDAPAQSMSIDVSYRLLEKIPV